MAIWGKRGDGGSSGTAQGEDGIAGACRQGPPGGQLGRHVEVLAGWVDADGDIAMQELAARLFAER